MSDESALWAAIAAKPGEDTPKLALADWYADNGNPVMERALRWCVARQRWPRATAKGAQSLWYGESRAITARNRHGVKDAHTLPGPVMALFPSTRRRRAEMRFRDAKEAVLHLAAALEKLRRVYDLKD